MKYSLIHGIKKPTPWQIRHWATSGCMALTTAGSYGALSSYPKTGLVIIILGVILKFLSLGFYEEGKTDGQP